MRGADLSKSLLYDITQYENLLLDNTAKLNNSILNDQKLVNYLISKKPDLRYTKITNKNMLKDFMKKMNWHNML